MARDASIPTLVWQAIWLRGLGPKELGHDVSGTSWQIRSKQNRKKPCDPSLFLCRIRGPVEPHERPLQRGMAEHMLQMWECFLGAIEIILVDQ